MGVGHVAERLLRYYATAGPLIEKLLGGIPFVWSTQPRGRAGPTLYHGPLSDKTRPKAPVVDVPTADRVRRYPQLSASRIEGLVRYGAVEIYSWSPAVNDPTRAGFARLLIEVNPHTPPKTLNDAVLRMRAVLQEKRFECVVVFDGGSGAALWIPLANAPEYDAVRAWLKSVCEDAITAHPELFTLEPNTHVSKLAHLHVSSNAVGRFSAVPYTVRGSKGYPVALPVSWALAGSFENGSVLADDLGDWLDEHGEAFSQELAEIVSQSLEIDVSAFAMPVLKSHGPIITAALEVLQDGRSHTAEEIAAIALKCKLLDATTPKYVYISLIEYIARTNGNGRKPAIVQNGDRSFRLDEPADEWPALDDGAEPAPPAAIAALIERLGATARSASGDAFEQAVCDAFAALGFAATHVGGQKAPDGYADALLGTRGYRVTIECKSGNAGLNDPSVFEASKFKDDYRAQYCALVGRAFSGEIELTKELGNHGVSAWTVDDLQTLLRVGANALEIEPLFAPGFAADRVGDVLWERRHGMAKRVRLAADAIVRTGWATQVAYHGVPADAPRLTEDVAMVLVDQDLIAQGSSATCSREVVCAAFDYLASPLVGRIRRDPGDGSAVVLGP
jgi:DNA primase